MQLNWIEMENFRQYNRKHKIEFAKGDKNITLVLGENNAGKTGIYRALIFGLYGDRSLAQDSSSPDIHLVNLKALESKVPIKASVRISVNSDKGEYIINRSIKAVNMNGKYTEDTNEDLSLDFRDQNGIYMKDHVEDSYEIQDTINKILDKNIKEFFLFDGEKIETLARAGTESRKEVKNGIIRLMEIDKLDKTRKIINNLENVEKRRLTNKSSNSKIKDIEKEKDELQNNIGIKVDQKEEYEKNLRSTIEEITNIEIELRKSEGIRELFNKKDKLTDKLNTIEEKIDISKRILIDYHFKQGASIILNDYFIKINKHFKDEFLKQDDLISIHVIEETLNRGICLCCNQEVTNSEETLAFLEKIKKNYKPSKVTSLMEIINRESIKNIKTKDQKINKIKSILEDTVRMENEKHDIKLQIAEIIEATSEESKTEEQIKNQADRHGVLILSKDRDKRALKAIKKYIEDDRIKLNEIDIKYNKHLKEDSSLKYEIKRLEVLINLNEKLNNIYNKYIKIIRGKLGEETTKAFKKLIDYEAMSMVDEIIISEKYEMDIIDSRGRNITQDISQGQQLIVALSLVTSLAKIASRNKDKVEYPLFMDTAFSKLSKENRRNLIDNLPKLTRQWIPLLTDTEYSNFEKDVFNKTNKVGIIYKIVKINKHESDIVRIDQ